MSAPPRLTLYTRADCGLCERARALLERLRAPLGLPLDLVDVDASDSLRARYGEAVPVVALDGVEIARAPIAPAALEARLRERAPQR